MIPLQLQLKNFLSYGAEFQTIDFSSYHLICLSGKNGHGKSAILDAMTWALWGQARKSAGAVRADQSLLRLGTTKMVVIFDFEFNNRAYRVKREFYVASGSKSHCILEFGMFETDGKTIIPLTDKTIRHTQRKIESTIGLDFETFTNSAFLRQGNANEFSKKSSRDRKDILCKILSIDQYEQLRRRATEKVKQAITQKEVLSRLQEKRRAQQEQLATLKNDHQQLLEDIKLLLEDEKNHKTEIEKNQKELLALQEKEHQKNSLEKELQKLTTEQRELWSDLKKARVEYRRIRALSLHGQKDLLEKRRNLLVHNIASEQTALQKKLILEKLLFDIHAKREALKQAHLQTHTQALQKLTLQSERTQAEIAQSKSQKEVLQTKEQNITKELAGLKTEQEKQITLIEKFSSDTITKQIQKITEQFEKRKNAYQHYVTLGNMVRSELQEIQQKQTLCKDEANSACPLCEQNLSASRRRFLKDKFDIQYKRLQTKFNRLKKVVPALKEVVSGQHTELQRAQKTHEESAIIRVQLEERTKSIEKLQQEQASIAKEIKTIESNTALLEKNYETLQKEFVLLQANAHRYEKDAAYKKLTQEYNAQEKELMSITHDEKKYKALQDELTILEKELASLSSIEKEEHTLSERKHVITTLLQQLRTIKVGLHTLEKNYAQYRNLSQEKDIIRENSTKNNLVTAQLEKRKEALLEKKGQLQTAQKHFDELKKEYAQEEKNIVQLHKIIQDYSIIATAASKEGIQALLIENAIPEIEHEANRLLSKLTNNNTQIIIESLRDLKRGGTKETLDINISDPAGIRPYELFSGGEAFRIDLALRVAISKLLARRAGTALQTLIIDEGFGSQDEDGLQNIMEAIYKIQDDFSKVIIVSHLPAMKDGFPVHFFVEKHPRGSTVSILEQG